MVTVLSCIFPWGQGGICVWAHREESKQSGRNAPLASADFLDLNPFLGPPDCVLLAICFASEHQVGIWY